MGKRIGLTALCLAVLLAGWRPEPREPDGLGLVRVLGVDGGGPTALSAVCGGDEGSPARGQCAGTDFPAALEELPWSGGEGKELSLTSVSHLVVGREVDLEPVLLAVLRNEELGATASVWLAEGGAAAWLSAREDPAGELDLLLRQGVEAPTAAGALAVLLAGEELVLPALGADGWTGWEGWHEQ